MNLPPDRFLLITEDNAARALLDQFEGGTAELLAEAARQLELGNARVAREYKHPTHWIVGTYVDPRTHPTDHGLSVLAIPKALCTRKVFFEQVARTMLTGN